MDLRRRVPSGSFRAGRWVPSSAVTDPVTVDPAAKALQRARVLLLIALPVVLLFGAFLWQVDSRGLMTLLPTVWAVVAGPPLVAVVHTQHRRARRVEPAFDPVVLARSGSYAAGALMGFFALGYLGLLLGAPLVIAAGATFALAWVRVEGPETILVRSIGATVPVLVFVGGLTLAERPIVAFVLFTMSASALLRLAIMRRRSTSGPRPRAGA